MKRLDMLGRHVRQRAADLAARQRFAVQLGVFRHIEIEQHRLPFVGQQHIGRLEIAMQNPMVVSMAKPIRQPGTDP